MVVWNNIAEFNLVVLGYLVKKVHHGRRRTRVNFRLYNLQKILVLNWSACSLEVMNWHLDALEVFWLSDVKVWDFYCSTAFLCLYSAMWLFLDLYISYFRIKLFLVAVFVIFRIWEIYLKLELWIEVDLGQCTTSNHFLKIWNQHSEVFLLLLFGLASSNIRLPDFTFFFYRYNGWFINGS